jgi:hypothetical protein
MREPLLLLTWTLVQLAACGGGAARVTPDAAPARAPAAAERAPALAVDAVPATPSPPAVPATRWMDAYDLDGDGQRDAIGYDFSGGAHCCYRLRAQLSSTRQTVRLPFQLDGGYPMGLDLSQPRRFAIRAPEGALPELIMEIETYNGRPRALDPAWKRRHGIRTHRIAACFAGGKLRVRDYVPALPPCHAPAPPDNTPPTPGRPR